MSLGKKIKCYRQAMGVSQLQLELKIETSPGRISKIENGLINPDKETIIKIAYALKLDSPQIASLFGINIPKLEPIFNEVNKLLITKNKQLIVNMVVNDLVFKLGYIASALFLVEGDRIYLRGLTSSTLSKKALGLLEKPLDSSYMLLSKDLNNLTVRAINQHSVYIAENTRDYCTPLVSSSVADNIQNATGDKSVIIFPLVTKQKKIGAIAYVKKIRSKFLKEREILKIVSDQIAIALFNSK